MTNKAASVRGCSQKVIVASSTLALVLAAIRPAFPTKVYATGNAYEWVKQVDQNLLGGEYTSAASSADGSHLIIGSKDGGEGYGAGSPLYVSADYGTTWSNVTDQAETGIRNHWSSVDVTNDGQTMVAASSASTIISNLSSADGKIFISHDSGDTWENISPVSAHQWHNVVISGDGSKIVATADDNFDDIYISNDGGDTWLTPAVPHVWNWESLSISDNGSKILVGGENNQNASSFIDMSQDGGDNWTDVTPDDGNMVFTTRTAMTATGDKIVVSTYGYDGDSYYDKVQISNNNGTSWTDATPADPSENSWSALAISDDGSKLSVQDDNDTMYISSDDGANWSAEDPGFVDNDVNAWRSIDFNADGSRAVTVSAGFAYVTKYDAPVPVTSVDFTDAESGSAVTLTTPSGTTITCHTPVKESGLSAQDGAYSYPLGLVDFCFSGADASNDVTLVFVTDLKPNEVAVRKYNPNTQQYATVTNATITETTSGGHHALQVTYAVVDNGPLDTDPDVGEIADPVGLAVLAPPSAPNTGLSYKSILPAEITALFGFVFATSALITPIRKRIYSRISSKK